MNSAVSFFGKSLDNEISKVSKRNEKATAAAQQRVVDRWLGREVKYRSVSIDMVERKTEDTAGPTASAEDEEVSFSFSGDGGKVE